MIKQYKCTKCHDTGQLPLFTSYAPCTFCNFADIALDDSELLFRWSVGDINTRTNKVFSNESMDRFLKMLRLSILSFRQYFPRAEYAVIYNGSNYEFFREVCVRAGIECPVLFSQNFKHSYAFSPKSVWLKWVPFRLDLNKTEIYVDSDIICFSRPDALVNHLKARFPIVVMPDPFAYFCEHVCGTYWTHPALMGRIPINCGFLALRPRVTFEDEFFRASFFRSKTHHADFLDEQGCFNVALYQSGVDFAFLQRDVNIYAPELLDRLNQGIQIHMCHFIGRTKFLFDEIEPALFRAITDRHYDPLTLQKEIAAKVNSFNASIY